MMAYKGIEMKNARPIIGVHVVGILRILSALWVELNWMSKVCFVRVSWRLCICFFLYETQYGLSLMGIARWRRV